MDIIVIVIAFVAAVCAAASAYWSRRAADKADGDSGKLDLRLESIERAVKDAQTAVDKLQAGMDMQQKAMESLRANVNDRIDKSRGETTEVLNQFRKELTDMSQKQQENADALRGAIKKEIESFRETIESFRLAMSGGLDKVRENVDGHLERMRVGNEKKLDEMRQTVDEKLESTLQKRLGESFTAVSKQLTTVHEELGKMQTLAGGMTGTMDNLQRVLTSAPLRGRMGEEMLENILHETLASDQYEKQWRVNPSGDDRVDFAIKIPKSVGEHVWLPVDSKFEIADYERYTQAVDDGDKDGAEKARKSFVKKFKNSAKTIRQKYVAPPRTTDCAVMFVPTEGLYSVLANEPGLFKELRQQHRTLVAGPQNFYLLVSTIKTGWQFFAISERSAEVWNVLSAVKTEFGNFGEVLAKVKKHLANASQSIDNTEKISEKMQKKLSAVEAPQQPPLMPPSLDGEDGNN